MAYSTIDKSSLYQSNVQHTGNGSTQSITGAGFEPSLIWIKNRSTSDAYNLVDSVRGATNVIYSDSGAAQYTNVNSITSFDADGFSVGNGAEVNANTNKYISWNWKMGTTSGIAGSPSITPTGYSFNATAGQSIIQWTGTEANGTLPHGLGVAPELIIAKTLATGSWYVYHKSLGADDAIFLNDSGAAATSSTYWNDTAPDANLFTVGTSAGTNDSGQTMIAYCFAGVNTNMFKAGKYTGNGQSDTDGPYIYTGFKPSLIFFKRTDTTSNWRCVNNKDGFNGDIGLLHPNLTDQESAGDTLDLLCNGCQIQNSSTDWNANGGEYVYFAWGQPIVSNSGVCTTARTGGIPT